MVRTADPNIDPNFGPALSRTYFDKPSWYPIQSIESEPESYATFENDDTLHTVYDPITNISFASRTRAHCSTHRVYRPPRQRRQTSRTSTRTPSSLTPPSTPPSTTQIDFVPDTTVDSFSLEYEGISFATQQISEPFDADGMTSFLRSLNLDYSIKKVMPGQL